MRKDGNRVYYSANRSHPLYKEILMSLKQWEDNGWLKPEPPSRDEIQNLFEIIKD